MLTLQAPAKVNLTLEVLGKRPDGYHEIKSVIQTIGLYDTLSIEEAERVVFECDAPLWMAAKSVLSKVIDMIGGKRGVKITLQKRIPLMSGLGGDSSDAAAVLLGLNGLWRLNLAGKNLFSLAARLGSDVPFFIRGGTALASGRGDIIEPLPSPADLFLVLVVPDIQVEPGKTGRMYAALKPSHFTDGSMTPNLVENLRKSKKVDSSMLFNTFENVAFDVFPGLDVYKEHLLKLGAPAVHLAGSGPTLFAAFNNNHEAEDLYRRCLDQGLKTYLVKTL
jgi:4-diphosphocytidyl-2-C-methyl-D-erythritol kinase